jgi:hypothetical protein
MCSSENDFGVILAANLMKRLPFEPLNDQQLPGCIDPCMTTLGETETREIGTSNTVNHLELS